MSLAAAREGREDKGTPVYNRQSNILKSQWRDDRGSSFYGLRQMHLSLSLKSIVRFWPYMVKEYPLHHTTLTLLLLPLMPLRSFSYGSKETEPRPIYSPPHLPSLLSISWLSTYFLDSSSSFSRLQRFTQRCHTIFSRRCVTRPFDWITYQITTTTSNPFFSFLFGLHFWVVAFYGLLVDGNSHPFYLVTLLYYVIEFRCAVIHHQDFFTSLTGQGTAHKPFREFCAHNQPCCVVEN